MSEIKENKKKKTKTSKTSKTILIVGLIIILIPCLILGFILIQASFEGSKPVPGSRYVNDLEPEITKANMETIENNIKTISDVEGVEISLISGQLRINVDVAEVGKDGISLICDKAYAAVNNELPNATYFTSSDTKKMYDLSINVYNHVGNDDGTMIYLILTKNAMMEEPSYQFLNETVNPDQEFN